MVESNVFEDIVATAKTAMRNGGGGDAPENDVEAIIDAREEWPDASNVILICDNNCSKLPFSFHFMGISRFFFR